MEFFDRIESRFAPQARITTLIVGLSGFYMVHILDAWSRFAELRYWWMHAMVLVWAIFTLMLFVVEPFVLPRQVKQTDYRDADRSFRRIRRMHTILLTLSLIALGGAVALGAWLAPMVGGDGTGDLRLAGGSSVVVQEGDTVWSIAGELAGSEQDVRVVVDAIEELNDLEGSVVVPGQVLQLP